MIPTAVLFALLAMVAWGLWAVLANEATQSLAPAVAMIISYAASVVVALGYVAATSGDISVPRIGVGYALAAGVFAGVGAVAFYAGLEAGRTGIVTTISALYFVVAAVVGVLVLGEPLSWHDGVGIVLAAAAVALLAS